MFEYFLSLPIVFICLKSDRLMSRNKFGTNDKWQAFDIRRSVNTRLTFSLSDLICIRDIFISGTPIIRVESYGLTLLLSCILEVLDLRHDEINLR